MDNNDILRRLRYTFAFNDTRMMELFGLGGKDATRAEISDWLKKDEDPAYQKLEDHRMAMFLNGMITDNRGAQEGEQPVAETRLNNNIVFRKLKIALNLKSEDVLAILESTDMRISKHELSAFFRKPGHMHFRECKDQVLRNFLQGMQKKYREGSNPETEESSQKK